MKARPDRNLPAKLLLLSLVLQLVVAVNAPAAGDMEEILPPISCGAGWRMEGKQLFYDQETLSDRIDGEAELYLPYGFDRLAAARYASPKSPGSGMDVEIFRMGSLLDAFGMYANYRQKDGRVLRFGADASLSPPQLYFYQGRHFVHIEVTGSGHADPEALAACGQAVASRLPGKNYQPAELSVFDRPEVVQASVRYLPESLLGYDFLNKGIIADAVAAGGNLRIFRLLRTTAASAATAFDRYSSQLAKRKLETGGQGALFLEGTDPLYGPVIVLKKNDCLAGALKFDSDKGIRALLESVCR